MSKQKDRPQFTPEELAEKLFGVDFQGEELGFVGSLVTEFAAPFAGVGERSPEARAFWDYALLWSAFYTLKYMEHYGKIPKHVQEVPNNYPGDLRKKGQIWQTLRREQTWQALIEEYSSTIEKRKKGSMRYQQAAEAIVDKLGTTRDLEQREDLSPEDVCKSAYTCTLFLGKTHEVIIASRRLVPQKQPSKRPRYE